MVKIIIVLIAIQYFIFSVPVKDKSVRLLVRTRVCTHFSITVVKLISTYYVWFYIHFMRHNTTELFLFFY